MAVDLGSLVATIEADTSQFETEADAVVESSEQMSWGLDAAATAAGNFAADLVSSGVSAMKTWVSSMFSSIDDTAKFSRELNISIDTLEGLRHAADQTTRGGASMLDKALERLTRRVGLAADGLGAAKTMFELLDIDARELVNLGVDEQFMSIAESISELPTAAARGAAAYQILGREGQQMIGMLELGRDGLRDMIDEMTGLQGSMSALDAGKVEAMNDALDRMWKAIQRSSRELAVELAPTFQAGIDSATDLVRWLRETDSSVVEVAVSTAKWAIGIAIAATAGSTLVRVSKQIITAIRGVTSAKAIMMAFAGPAGWAKIAAGAVAAAGAVIAVEYAFSGVVEEAKQVSSEAEEAAKQVEDLTREINESQEASASAGQEERYKAIGNVINGLKKELRELTWTEDQFLSRDLVSAGVIDPAVFEYAERLKEAIDEAKRQNEIDDLTQSLQEQVDTFGKSSTELTLYRLRLEGASSAQMEFAKSLADQLEQMENQQALDNFTESLQHQIDTFGMSRREAELYRLSQLGLSEAALEAARALSEQLDALEAQEKLMRAGERVFEETRTPLERYIQRLDDLSEMLEAGAINFDTYQRAIAKADEEYEQSHLNRNLGGVDEIESLGRMVAGGVNARFTADSMQHRTEADIARANAKERNSSWKTSDVQFVRQIMQDIHRKMDTAGTLS